MNKYDEKMNIDNMSNNKYANLIYDRPENRFKRWLYYHRKIKPLYKKIKKGPASFDDMCQFSDFIKILEMVFFYHNDIKYIEKIDDEIRIISDNNINNVVDKNLTIIDDKNKVTIIFSMYKIFYDETNSISEHIDISCRNEFGKKLNTNFNIANSEVINKEINTHTYNLLYNINKLLSKCMAELFLKYYKLS